MPPPDKRGPSYNDAMALPYARRGRLMWHANRELTGTTLDARLQAIAAMTDDQLAAEAAAKGFP